jgi:hypothetical protein
MYQFNARNFAGEVGDATTRPMSFRREARSSRAAVTHAYA